MDLLIKGRRALVTGASLGIGRAVADELAREGCDVAMVARTEDTLRKAADDIARATGKRVVAVPADASVPEAVASAVAQATQALGGPIDILVNNAGSTPEDGIDRLDFDKWQYSVALKQFGYARIAGRNGDASST
jgi:3-oxoacyl-[acyl-carrier protein] reductase